MKIESLPMPTRLSVRKSSSRSKFEVPGCACCWIANGETEMRHGTKCNPHRDCYYSCLSMNQHVWDGRKRPPSRDGQSAGSSPSGLESAERIPVSAVTAHVLRRRRDRTQSTGETAAEPSYASIGRRELVSAANPTESERHYVKDVLCLFRGTTSEMLLEKPRAVF
jgi:hypothetical protein